MGGEFWLSLCERGLALNLLTTLVVLILVLSLELNPMNTSHSHWTLATLQSILAEASRVVVGLSLGYVSVWDRRTWPLASLVWSTLVCIVIALSFNHLRVANGGHFPLLFLLQFLSHTCLGQLVRSCVDVNASTRSRAQSRWIRRRVRRRREATKNQEKSDDNNKYNEQTSSSKVPGNVNVSDVSNNNV